MNYDAKYAVAEDRLGDGEADSFGALLEQLGDIISPVLVGGDSRQRLLKRANTIPATVAAFPFGFEFPLESPQAEADFGVTVIGETKSAGVFEMRGQLPDATPSEAGFARLLQDIRSKETPVRQIIGRKVMLEYDIATVADSGYWGPGIFLRPAEQIIHGGCAQEGAVKAVINALVGAAGWTPHAGEQQHAVRLYQALGRAQCIASFGAFPSRERAIRMVVSGFPNCQDLSDFLLRIGWPAGNIARVEEAVKGITDHVHIVNMDVNLDVTGNGLAATLGLNFMTKPRAVNDPHYWIDHPQQWRAFLDYLNDSGCAVADKLSALGEWTTGLKTLFGKSGPFLLIRGIHHFKFVFREDHSDKIKAYVYCLICPWQSESMILG